MTKAERKAEESSRFTLVKLSFFNTTGDKFSHLLCLEIKNRPLDHESREQE